MGITDNMYCRHACAQRYSSAYKLYYWELMTTSYTVPVAMYKCVRYLFKLKHIGVDVSTHGGQSGLMDYDNHLKFIRNDAELRKLYSDLENGYSKLQVFRMMDLVSKSNSNIAKFVNETYHIENDYIMQLNPAKFQTVPDHILSACDKIVDEEFSAPA